ncbi:MULTISPECIES: hypothetical protein [unclassified Synechocystis]|uniref:hypothetical protein n=1 Tax=unclassified Synechocystis TaxID=2640012 RepID=UPI001CBC7B74|nr:MULTISPECIES: hypothetical protein [unclassified Synechocystis]
MTNLPHHPESASASNQDRQIFLEAIAGRERTLADVIGQAGGDFLKGESPVPKLIQRKTELKLFVNDHLRDSEGALLLVLQNRIDEADALISKHLEFPLMALNTMVEQLLDNSALLKEIVRQADFRWGQIYGERPHFEIPGKPPDPDDPYTAASVTVQLKNLLLVIAAEKSRSQDF